MNRPGWGLGGYTRATEGDHRPATDFAGSAGRGGAAADASAEANVDGANGIARFSQDEITELMEVPDPDSPGGIAATLKIIEKYQGESLSEVERRAAQEQAHAMQVAGSYLTNPLLASPDADAVKSLLEEMLVKLASLPPGDPAILELQKEVHKLELDRSVCSAADWRNRVYGLVAGTGGAVAAFPNLENKWGRTAFVAAVVGAFGSADGLLDCVAKAVKAP